MVYEVQRTPVPHLVKGMGIVLYSWCPEGKQGDLFIKLLMVPNASQTVLHFAPEGQHNILPPCWIGDIVVFSAARRGRKLDDGGGGDGVTILEMDPITGRLITLCLSDRERLQRAIGAYSIELRERWAASLPRLIKLQKAFRHVMKSVTVHVPVSQTLSSVLSSRSGTFCSLTVQVSVQTDSEGREEYAICNPTGPPITLVVPTAQAQGFLRRLRLGRLHKPCVSFTNLVWANNMLTFTPKSCALVVAAEGLVAPLALPRPDYHIAVAYLDGTTAHLLKSIAADEFGQSSRVASYSPTAMFWENLANLVNGATRAGGNPSQPQPQPQPQDAGPVSGPTRHVEDLAPVVPGDTPCSEYLTLGSSVTETSWNYIPVRELFHASVEPGSATSHLLAQITRCTVVTNDGARSLALRVEDFTGSIECVLTEAEALALGKTGSTLEWIVSIIEARRDYWFVLAVVSQGDRRTIVKTHLLPVERGVRPVRLHAPGAAVVSTTAIVRVTTETASLRNGLGLHIRDGEGGRPAKVTQINKDSPLLGRVFISDELISLCGTRCRNTAELVQCFHEFLASATGPTTVLELEIKVGPGLPLTHHNAYA